MKREATTRSPLADLEKNAAEIQKTFSDNLNTLVQSPQSVEFQKTLKEGSDSVLQQLSTLAASLQSAVSNTHNDTLSCTHIDHRESIYTREIANTAMSLVKQKSQKCFYSRLAKLVTAIMGFTIAQRLK